MSAGKQSIFQIAIAMRLIAESIPGKVLRCRHETLRRRAFYKEGPGYAYIMHDVSASRKYKVIDIWSPLAL